MTHVRPEGYLYVQATARLLGVSEQTVRVLFDEGVLQGMRGSNGYRLIKADSVGSYTPVRHLTVSQAAERLACSHDTVRWLFDQGALGGHRTPRGHRRIDPSVVPAAAGC